MRNKQGGTRKWCPECKAVRVIESLAPSSLCREPNQRLYRREYEDIHYFQRGQQCRTCYHCWVSAEVPESFIHELIKLRNELREITETAEAHSKEPEYGSLRLL
jgi:hypothetical protein